MLKTATWAILTALLVHQQAEARTITVVNQCGTKIFPAYAGKTARLMQDGTPAPAGWEIPAGGRTVLDLPDTWLDGRIWIRSGGEGCDTDVTKCLIGQCQSSGGLECDGTELGGLGRTLAEFGMQPGQDDFYDVSMVEAFTVAMKITPSDSSCPVGSCGVDADPLKHCDASLAWPKGSDQIWGCANPCMAGVQFTSLMSTTFDFQQSPSCCQGSWADDKCTHDVIPFYDDLKKLCKSGYVYAKDDLEMDGPQSAIHNCPSKPSYTLEICAGGANTGLIGAPSINAAVPMNPGSRGELNVQGRGGRGGGPAVNASATSGHGSSSSGPWASSAAGQTSSTTGIRASSPSVDAGAPSSASLPPGVSPLPSPGPPSGTPLASGLNALQDATSVVPPGQAVTRTRPGDAGNHRWAGGVQMPAPTPSACNKKRRLQHQ